ncbi:MAG: hypothetical protein ACR2OZ_16615 [Verrucomicrobiales bacterium]
MFSRKSLFTWATVLIAANAFAAGSPSLADLQGKWFGKRTSSNGQEVTQSIEIKGDQLVFQIINADKEVRLFAKGTVKAEMLRPFSVLRITGLEAGKSPTELEPVADELNSVYVLRTGTLIVASNFDKDRDNRQPSLDKYERGDGAQETANSKNLAGNWKLTAKMGEDDRDYELKLVDAAGQLSGTLVSPRSGEHKFNSVTFTEGKLTMELPREFEGNQLTLLYTGTLKDGELSGDFVVTGHEDQFKGTWKATK